MEKGKLVAVSVSSILVIAVVASVAVISSSKGGSGGGATLATSSKSVQTVCQPVDYKDTCASALKDASDKTNDPKQLVKAAFQATIDSVRNMLNQNSFAQDAAKDKRTAEALDTCKELLDYAVKDITDSFNELGELDAATITKAIDDLKVWLGAAITHQETCLDGFENTTTDTGDKMKAAMKTGMELTSNALAIVSEIGSILGGINIDSVLKKLETNSQGEPAWMTSTQRRLLQTNTADLKPNVVVAQDGSGDCKTIKECLLKVPNMGKDIFVIHVKEGVYKEQVEVARTMTNVMMVGDGATKTKITGSLNFIDGVGTFKTAVLAVVGNGFIGKDFGVENTAGAIKHQAVALRVGSDMSVFHNCRFDAFQDTLYAHSKRQFYRDCTISGTIDFIFGTSPAMFQNCLILVREPLSNQQNICTAQGRKDRRDPSAIILHNCTITADPAFAPMASKFMNYLGRPWKEFSRTIYIQSYIDSIIHPDGWLPWMGTFGLNTCFYAEVDNRGPGSDTSKRVTWNGVKHLTYQDAQTFSVDTYIQGSKWLPRSGVPFTAGLLPKGYGGSKN